MKTTLLLVGKTDNKLYAEGIEDYVARTNHYTPFCLKIIPELKNTKSLNEKQQKEKEGELILKNIDDKSYVVLLDEHGKEFRSVEFAAWLGNKQQTIRQLTFVIGGPMDSLKPYMIVPMRKCHYQR